MYTQVIKIFTLQIKPSGGNEIGESVSKVYIFTCRNCQKEFTMQFNNYDKVEFTLSTFNELWILFT